MSLSKDMKKYCVQCFFSIADKRYISTLLDTRAARNDRTYQAPTNRGRTIDQVYYKSAISASEFVDLVRTAV